jgi:hypothetical protein
LEEPLYAEHIAGGWEGAFEAAAVFALAGVSWAVVDGDFGEFESGAFDEGGDEAVHAGERDEGVSTIAAHGLEGATGIADAIAGEAGADSVGDATLEAFEGGVFAGGAVSANEVEALVEFVGELEDIGGIVLEVAVEEGDDFAVSGVDAGVEGGALPGILFKLEEADVGVTPDRGDGIVGGAVIDKDEFVMLVAEGGVDFLLEAGDVVFLVIEGDDDGEFWGGACGVWIAHLKWDSGFRDGGGNNIIRLGLDNCSK